MHESPLAMFFKDTFIYCDYIENELGIGSYPPWLCPESPPTTLADNFKKIHNPILFEILDLFASLVNVPDLNGETPIFYVCT